MNKVLIVACSDATAYDMAAGKEVSDTMTESFGILCSILDSFGLPFINYENKNGPMKTSMNRFQEAHKEKGYPCNHKEDTPIATQWNRAESNRRPNK